ncbi:MAG: prepilin-type N-terminal cleavage/methylation domain-containing protein, partial [Desulfobulbaceae bacterium]|nr:prepilin-type N-terminal cleavage/methylation domain-containing protein [Desulfobulbaceae bacterium]
MKRQKGFSLLELMVLLIVIAVGVLWCYLDSVAAKALTEGVQYAGG